jgi:hypothetical protein
MTTVTLTHFFKKINSNNNAFPKFVMTILFCSSRSDRLVQNFVCYNYIFYEMQIEYMSI